MSQYSAQTEFRPASPVSNPLGLAGFICSIFGLACTLGVLCPIGFVLSAIGLLKRPRGFALAGTIIGGLGTFVCLIILFIGFLTAVIADGAVKAIRHGAPYVKSIADGASLYHQVTLYKDANGTLPKTLEDLHIDNDALVDGWGHKFRYHLNEDGTFTVTSDGPDGKQGTIDDIRCTSDNIGPRKIRSKRLRNAV